MESGATEGRREEGRSRSNERGGGIDQGRGARKCAESRDVGTGSKEDWVGACERKERSTEKGGELGREE